MQVTVWDVPADKILSSGQNGVPMSHSAATALVRHCLLRKECRCAVSVKDKCAATSAANTKTLTLHTTPKRM